MGELLAGVAHGAVALFVVLGGLLALRWPRVVWFHAPAVLWGTLVEVTGFDRPVSLGAAILVVNAAVYAFVLRRRALRALRAGAN